MWNTGVSGAIPKLPSSELARVLHGQEISYIQERFFDDFMHMCIMCLCGSLTKIVPILDPFYTHVICYFFPDILNFFWLFFWNILKQFFILF